MRLAHAVQFVTAAFLVTSSAAAATASQDCAAMVSLLRQARTDFASLREKKMDPGKCALRQSEFRCAWHFPGDRFDESDAQEKRLVGCVAAYPAAQPLKGKGDVSAFAVDPDLTLLIPRPELDDDGWKVQLTIRSSWKP